jgi:transposase
VKKAETIMEILAAYDLTHSYRDAAELVGCAPNTVARYVRTRDAGGLRATPVQRTQLVDAFREKIEQWVDASHGRVRADVAQRKLEAMGYTGSERTTRRAVAEAKATYRAGHRRRFRPWLPEPGLWFQRDYADGPLVDSRKTWLWCAWLAWSRYRVVLPIRDKTLPTVIACIDVTLRRFGGVPTYGLSDNEKTLTLDHIARIAVRHPTMVDVGRYYVLTLASCVPADPQSKGGSEATVRISSADLVPTDANLLPDYTRFAELRIACDALGERINARPHRATRCPPIERLGSGTRALASTAGRTLHGRVRSDPRRGANVTPRRPRPPAPAPVVDVALASWGNSCPGATARQAPGNGVPRLTATPGRAALPHPGPGQR